MQILDLPVKAMVSIPLHSLSEWNKTDSTRQSRAHSARILPQDRRPYPGRGVVGPTGHTHYIVKRMMGPLTWVPHYGMPNLSIVLDLFIFKICLRFLFEIL